MRLRSCLLVLFAGFLPASSVVLTGCSSAKSTVLLRDEMNMGWTQIEDVEGVPITLRVPTHLRVAIVEKHYLVANSIGGVTQVTRAELQVPLRGVQHDFLFTEKIFVVDFKRPAAGRMTLAVDFDENRQYFKRIEHEVVDETIADVTELIGSIAPGGIFPAAVMGGTPWDATIREVESVVAVRVFEIDAPDFEQQLTAFLDCHINQAHDAWVVPPDVDSIKRVPLENHHVEVPPLCPSEFCPPFSAPAMPLGVPSISGQYDGLGCPPGPPPGISVPPAPVNGYHNP